MVIAEKICILLETLEKRRFMPGRNMKITTRGNDVYFESESNVFPPCVRKVILMLYEHLKEHRELVAGRGVELERIGGKLLVSVHDDVSERAESIPACEVETPVFPFKTVVTGCEGAGVYTVSVQSPLSSGNMVFIGTHVESVEPCDFKFSSAGYIYLMIEVVSDELVIELRKEETLLYPGLTKYPVLIAGVKFEENYGVRRIVIEQHQFGHVYVAGRIV